MVNRWKHRTEPEPGHETLYWHILLGDQPQVRALASITQERLADFQGLHFTPQHWLHITTLAIGPGEDYTPTRIADMTHRARQLLSETAPITVVLNKILYHPEAIVLKVEPDYALDPIREAVQEATYSTTERARLREDQPWRPHVTLAYSTATQPAYPIIYALGRNLASSEAIIHSVSLVAQEGAERLWNWHRLAEVALESKDTRSDHGVDSNTA